MEPHWGKTWTLRFGILDWSRTSGPWCRGWNGGLGSQVVGLLEAFERLEVRMPALEESLKEFWNFSSTVRQVSIFECFEATFLQWKRKTYWTTPLPCFKNRTWTQDSWTFKALLSWPCMWSWVRIPPNSFEFQSSFLVYLDWLILQIYDKSWHWD